MNTFYTVDVSTSYISGSTKYTRLCDYTAEDLFYGYAFEAPCPSVTLPFHKSVTDYDDNGMPKSVTTFVVVGIKCVNELDTQDTTITSKSQGYEV